MRVFRREQLRDLHKSDIDSSGEQNGQVTIIGGSKLFHGAPILSLKVASRIVDMVFFATPEPSVGRVAEKFKSKLFSYIWVPWEDVGAYIKKSDSVLMGPGFMRFRSEKTPEDERHSGYDEVAKESRETTEKLLKNFPDKRWVIDAGSLQVMEKNWIPRNAILTPNQKEFEMLFNVKCQSPNVKAMAKKYNCVINSKGPTNVVCSNKECVEVKGGNTGLEKGGTGDVLAGLAVALLAKNEPFLAASAASYVTKAAADALYKKVGVNYNADDLADKIPEMLHRLAN